MRARTRREKAEERKAYAALRRAVRAAGVALIFSEDDKDSNFVVLSERKIVLRKGMSLRRTMYTLAHEFGHIKSNLGSFMHVRESLRAVNPAENHAYVKIMADVVEELDAWEEAYQFIPSRLLIDCKSFAAMCLKTYASRKTLIKAEKLRRK